MWGWKWCFPNVVCGCGPTTAPSTICTPVSGCVNLHPDEDVQTAAGSEPTSPVASPATPETATSTLSATRGVAHVQINIDNNPNICSLERRAPYECTWDTTKVGDGQHRLSAVITDKQNSKRTTAVTVTVHNNLTKRPPGRLPGDVGVKPDSSARNCGPSQTCRANR